MLADFETIVAKKFHIGIMKLCKVIGTGTLPVFIKVLPEPQSTLNQCVQNVRNKIEKHGGDIQHGWLIWEAPNVLIEGEFHAAWRSPAGALICVSPREDGEDVLVFLPDNSRKFEGLPVLNTGISWPKSSAVDRLLEKEAAFQRFKNRHPDPRTGAARFPKKEHDWHVREIEAARRMVR